MQRGVASNERLGPRSTGVGTTVPMNRIPELQNAEQQLKVLRARKELYLRANNLLFAQLGATVVLPLLAAILALAIPALRPFVATAALIALAADVAFLDRPQKAVLKSAAKLQEQFDCAVLDLPWNDFSVGDPVLPEEINEASSAYLRRRSQEPVRDWYAVEVGRAPIHLARVLCQQTNLWYDGKLRRTYARLILVLVLGSFSVIGLLGVVSGVSFPGLVTSVLAPATPAFGWTIREYYRQMDTVTLLDSLRSKSERLWRQVLTGTCSPADCAAQARAFQNAIYDLRLKSPLQIPFLYSRMRSSMEAQMTSGIKDRVEELERLGVIGRATD